MHAYLPLPADMVLGFNFAMIGVSDIADRIEAKNAANAKAAFDQLLGPASISRAHQHLMAGHPIDAIPEAARETRAAIVVMGAVSRSGLKRVLIGNTAERVLDQLACDVLVVKPPRFVTHVHRAQRGARLTVTPTLI
jgi:universal stress protein E